MKEYWFPDPSILLLRAKNTITPHALLPSCMINVKKTQIDFFVFNIRKHEIMKIGQDNENYMALIIWQCTHKSRITRGMIAYGMKLKHYWHSTFVLLCTLFDNICIIKNILTSSRLMRCIDLFYFLLLIIPKYVLDITSFQICRLRIFPFVSQSSANTTEEI